MATKKKAPSPRRDAPLHDLTVVDRPIASLKPYKRNARMHSKKPIEQIAASIEEFGFTSPILVDDNGEIIAGHGRLEAARLLGMTSVPAIVLSHLSTGQRTARGDRRS